MADRTAAWIDGLREAGFRGALEVGRELAPLTTWRLGGPAELLATPDDADDLAAAVRWTRRAGVSSRVLGNGSNLLVSDAGVPGVVLRVRRVLDSVEIDGTTVRCGAGASFPAVARRAARAGLAGLEFAAGIPGTVGGAVVMNAGWHAYEIGNHVHAVDVVDEEGVRRTIPGDACGFRYRGSRFRDGREVVLGAELRLVRGERAAIEERLDAFAASRKANQPTDLPSCGSVFLKPPGDFAGRLIEAAGLKGERVGGVEVSTLHANFFVNVGGGTAADAHALVERVEEEVERRFGVRLVREFVVW